MGYFGRNPNLTFKGRSKKSYAGESGVPTSGRVRQIINKEKESREDNVFYELEPAEVVFVFDTEDKLPTDTDGQPIYRYMGCVKARRNISQLDTPLTSNDLQIYYPLHPNDTQLPLIGEYVVTVDYMDTPFFTRTINISTSHNANVRPGKSGKRPEETIEEDYEYENFELENPLGYDPLIKKLQPYEGDITYEGRFGQSIRFGSNIVSDAHDDKDSTQSSPNILIRAGQLTDGVDFDKNQELVDVESIPYKPVKEDINADGSSIWVTTDQSVKLNIDKTNASDHSYMTQHQNDDQPKEGGKQITINSDRITFNTKKGKILGFSADGIGFSTRKVFSVDADDGMQMNSGGATNMSMQPGGISLVTPGNSRLDLGQGGQGGGTDIIYLSSECPSFLSLDDKAHLESCKGANVHLDDCAGLYTHNGSYFKIGGSNDEAVIYIKGRDDVKEQHLVFGEELADLLDSICNSFVELGTTILDLNGIATGAGPSGPISSGPANQALITAWEAGVETIRARICNILTKVG